MELLYRAHISRLLLWPCVHRQLMPLIRAINIWCGDGNFYDSGGAEFFARGARHAHGGGRGRH
ncbi:hypothetical protein CFR73_13390 [Novacetimonas maltaceti]|nr:hypothetical protein CFR73_13390 [Novacetimonas maltaceti]